jgi:ABC-type bacteriocin/lantibiotic exporter with double-glycine peptidase domain
MMSQPKVSSLRQLSRVLAHISPRRKRQLALLGLIMVGTAFFEVISIGAILPFLSILVAPETIYGSAAFKPLLSYLSINAPNDLLLPFTLIFAAAAIFAGAARIILLWAQVRLSTSIATDLSTKAYEKILSQPYNYHITKNSGELLALIGKASGLANGLVQPYLSIASSALILIAVVVTLLLVNTTMAIGALAGFTLIYVTVISTTKRYIAKNSLVISLQHGAVNKTVQEGLGGIRDTLLDGTQALYADSYRKAFAPLQSAQANVNIVSASPRFGVEAFGMVLIALLAYAFVNRTAAPEELSNIIPVLGALGVGAQRLLPVIQQIYSSYIGIKGNRGSTDDALEILEKPVPELAATETKAIALEARINLTDLGFRYSTESPWVLRNLSLQIPRGSRIGLVGVTGSGKSTLIDVITGLLEPSEGKMYVDNVEINTSNSRFWQQNIAHVPQNIFLSDSSIAENIAFGTPRNQINMDRVREAAKSAQISETVDSFEYGYETLVGERGLRLSGGQRQRIGLARALYKQKSVIILDEATSALDTNTEDAVMKAIESLGRDKTIVIIAHRLSTLRKCDQIIEIESGSIKSVSIANSIHAL